MLGVKVVLLRMRPQPAVLESVRTRIRPIFMTASIGLFGLLPLVTSPGAGSELYRGLGAVLLGGLVASTVFTLIFVPALFSLVFNMRDLIFGRGRMTPASAGAALTPHGAIAEPATTASVTPQSAAVSSPIVPPDPGTLVPGV